MSDFTNYMLQQARADEAKALCNYAIASLANAKIMERLAQIKSQHEPLGSLAKGELTERERMYAAAFFVVNGRLPT